LPILPDAARRPAAGKIRVQKKKRTEFDAPECCSVVLLFMDFFLVLFLWNPYPALA